MPVTGTHVRFDDTGYLYAPQVAAAYLAPIRRVVRTFAEKLEEHMQLGMKKRKHGRVYWRPGRLHTASAPGESPAVDYGNLIEDIDTKFTNSGLTAEVGTKGTEYAEYLEKGTRRMKKRPFAKPAFDAYKTKFVERVIATIENVSG